MSVIKQLLILHKSGTSIKSIARTLSISKNTVRSYLLKFCNGSYDIDQLIKLDDPILEGKFHAGNPAYSDERYQTLKDKLEYFVAELKKRGVTRKLLWEEYIQDIKNHYSYSQFCFHLDQHMRARKPVMVLDHEPGAELMIDYAGKKSEYIDHESGLLVPCEIFVGVMPGSGYCYVQVTHTQRIEDFIGAVASCLGYLGGVPKAIVSDNLKSAVTQSSRYEPKINQVFEDLANHYGCAIVPARALKPRDKASVEGMVKIVYSQIFARLRKRQFFSLSELNEAIIQQTLLLNQRRLTDKTYTREEKFVASEKPLLAPLPEQKFEIKHYAKYKVAQNNHIRLSEDGHYYSVPFQYIGRQVKVIYTSTAVRIYLSGKLIAGHFRDTRRSKYSTLADHLCSQHQHYLQRSPAYYTRQAQKNTPAMVLLFEKIFEQDKYPEQLYRTCDGILHRYKKLRTPALQEAFDQACLHALELGVYSYGFIDNYLKNNMQSVVTKENLDKPLPKHENIRGREFYQ